MPEINLLTPVELRVLGSLMEKARTTPDIYPLTLNALVNACNQKTSRDPVSEYDEDEVLEALDKLREKGLVMRVDMAGSRTAKFRERASEQWKLNRQEYALLTPLFLRGPQTPGQLRQRSERLFPFAEVNQTIEWLERLQQRDEEPLCLVRPLGRAPGTKEIRYLHTLMEPPEEDLQPTARPEKSSETPPAPSREELAQRVLDLEERIAALEKLLHELTN